MNIYAFTKIKIYMQEAPKAWEKYRHYKSTWWSDHTYEIIWIAKHSETEELMVIYKPIYNAKDSRIGDTKFAARPLYMWFEQVEHNGEMMQRFIII